MMIQSTALVSMQTQPHVAILVPCYLYLVKTQHVLPGKLSPGKMFLKIEKKTGK